MDFIMRNGELGLENGTVSDRKLKRNAHYKNNYIDLITHRMCGNVFVLDAKTRYLIHVLAGWQAGRSQSTTHDDGYAMHTHIHSHTHTHTLTHTHTHTCNSE